MIGLVNLVWFRLLLVGCSRGYGTLLLIYFISCWVLEFCGICFLEFCRSGLCICLLVTIC